MSNSTTAPAPTTAAPPLPLDWTSSRRRRRRRPSGVKDLTTHSWNGGAQDDDNDEWFVCRCSDARRCRRRRLESSVDCAAAVVVNGRSSAELPKASSSTARPTSNISASRVRSGTVVVCLTDPDADWFQGYLFTSGNINSNNSNSSIYYGLLGRIQELDECLQCADGGYRELTLQVTEMGGPRSTINNDPDKTKETFEFSNIAWTGGDMMRLRSIMGTADVDTYTNAPTSLDAPTVRMDADRVETGTPAYQRVQALFGSLLRRLRQHTEEEEPVGSDEDESNKNASSKSSVADLMPNVAVVIGRMELRIPDDRPPK